MDESTARGTSRRLPGEGAVYRRKDRPGWRGRLRWTEPDGTRRQRVVQGRTAAEARDKLDDLRRDLRMGTVAPKGKTQTLAEYLAAWIERDAIRVRTSTHKAREMHCRVYLVPALGRLALTRLSAADVEGALASFMRSGRPDREAKARRGRPSSRAVSAQTARHIRATLRVALADAVREGLVARNAAADARPPYAPVRPIAYLTAAQVRTLLDATEEHDYGPLYALLVSTGLRLGEALALRWSDVDTEHGVLTVRRSLAMAPGGGWQAAAPKSARSRRSLPLPATARMALLRQRGRQDGAQAEAGAAWQDVDGLVFTDGLGRHLRPEAVSGAFQKAREAAGLPHVRLHDLRHSAATLLLAEGVPLAVISSILGHSGVAITMQHYAAVVPELHEEAARAMERALGGS